MPIRTARPFGGGRFEVDRWLRVEHLAQDFIALIAEFREPTPEERRQVAGLPRVNAIEYDHDVSHWFTPAQVRSMYRHNPRWAALEELRDRL